MQRVLFNLTTAQNKLLTVVTKLIGPLIFRYNGISREEGYPLVVLSLPQGRGNCVLFFNAGKSSLNPKLRSVCCLILGVSTFTVARL